MALYHLLLRYFQIFRLFPVMSPPPIPSAQIAIVEDKQGKPVIAQNMNIPKLRPGTILVRTVAVALNPSDFKMGMAFPSPGSVVGMDFAGNVVAIHDLTTRNDLQVGEAVCGMVYGSNPGDQETGSFAAYLIVAADLVLKLPQGLPFEQAAGMGCGLFTSTIALWGSLGLQFTPQNPANTKECILILVYGGSTASGTMAIQLLKL